MMYASACPAPCAWPMPSLRLPGGLAARLALALLAFSVAMCGEPEPVPAAPQACPRILDGPTVHLPEGCPAPATGVLYRPEVHAAGRPDTSKVAGPAGDAEALQVPRSRTLWGLSGSCWGLIVIAVLVAAVLLAAIVERYCHWRDAVRGAPARAHLDRTGPGTADPGDRHD